MPRNQPLDAHSVAFLIPTRLETRHQTLVNWKKIRLELADTRDHPRGSVSRGYLVCAPLDERGAVDEVALAKTPHRAIVRRFWSTEPDEKGELVRADGHFVFRCSGKPDRPIFDGIPLRVGAQIDVVGPTGDTLPFRVASISRVGQESLPSAGRAAMTASAWITGTP